MKLVIGNKNYSSWSLRPWIFLSEFGIEFEEERVLLFEENTDSILEQYNSNYKVPILIDRNITLWDSLAIIEYINETYLNHKGLPQDIRAKALCRSMCAEMHSSFFSLREECRMNIKKHITLVPSNETERDIARIDALWQLSMSKYGSGGSYLFGDFSMADAMFIPVVMRFVSYNISVSDSSMQYIDTILSNSHTQQWMLDAKEERETITITE